MALDVLAVSFLLLVFLVADAAFVPDHVLRITVGTIQQDCRPRVSTLINGTYPAPPLYLEPDVTSWVRVYNDADVNATIHWHGLSLAAAPYADGSPQASQWPIPPGRFFDYEVHPKAHEAGTSYYHSHVGFQAVTAVGALIVKDAGPPPYHYDEERILLLGDYYAAEDHAIEAQLTSRPWSWPGDPVSLLINGRSGRVNAIESIPVEDKSCYPFNLEVEPNKTYRVRLISATAMSLVLLGIEEHQNLTVIETDNSYVVPIQTSYMQGGTGQRFSFLLKTKSEEELMLLNGKTDFWIQAESREADTLTRAWALLTYKLRNNETIPDLSNVTSSEASHSAGSQVVPTSSLLELPDKVTSWLEYAFVNPTLPGYAPPPTSDEVTRRITISTLQFSNDSSGFTEMKSNGESWHDQYPTGSTAPVPYLVQVLSHGTINGAEPDYERAQNNEVQPGYDPVTHTYPAKIGEVIEIIWQNAASFPLGIYGSHPLHAHGGPYWDLGSGPGVYTPEAHQELLRVHTVNGSPWPGSRRDTTLLHRYRQSSEPGDWDGWRVWRFRVTEANVGVWMMHCHILQHIIMGQSIVWVFGTSEQIRAHTEPVDGVLDGYFVYGGNVVGTEGAEDDVMRARYFG